MKIVNGSEKIGFALKNAIAADLTDKEFSIFDIGTDNGDKLVSFGEIADKASQMILHQEAERGILICGTGMGMSLAANKRKGIYAAVVESEFGARYCRLLNNANILCKGAFIVGKRLALDIVKVFLNTGFLENFEQWRIDFLTSEQKKLKVIEDREFK